MKPSQKDMILGHLLSGARLCQSDASAWFGCARLASRIDELRQDGSPIQSVPEMVNGRRFVSYRYLFRSNYSMLAH